MKKLLPLLLAAVMLAVPFGAMAGPDENQRMMMQHAQEAKQKLAAAESAKGAERQKMMQEHMKMMQDIMSQMQKAKPASGMSPEQMREWIDEHLKLMDQMMSQMMEEHHLMMQQSMGK